MEKSILTLVVLGLLTRSFGQDTGESTSQMKAGGLICSTYEYSWFGSNEGKLNHIEGYPGFDNITGVYDAGAGTLEPYTEAYVFESPDTEMRSIDINVRTNSVYLHDYAESKIVLGSGYNSKLKNITFDDLPVPASKGIQVAVDWLSHTVYWTDSAFGWILATSGEKSKLDMNYRKTIIQYNIGRPSGIAVDPFEGKLFWSDNGREKRIEWSDLDGGSREVLISSKFCVAPTALDVDITDKRIYWINRDDDKILTASYYQKGEDIKKIKSTSSISTLTDIVTFRNILYVVDSYERGIYTFNRTLGKDMGKQEADIISFYPSYVNGIAVYGEEKQPLKDKDYCEELKCDQLCISTKTGATCSCSDDYTLDKQTGKCEKDKLAYTKSLAFANATHICLIHIEILSRKISDHECVFTVIKQSKAQPDPVPNRRRRRQVSPSTGAPATGGNSTPAPTQAPTQSPTTMRPSTTPNPTTPKPTTPKPTTPKPTTAATTTPTTTMTTTEPPPTAAPGDTIKWFDMDMKKRIFFFVTEDNSIYTRFIDVPIENEAKQLIVKASNVTGIAYDALDEDYIYLSQADGYIIKVKYTTEKVEILNEDNTVTNPRNLILLLKERKLAMITGNDGEESIQTMNLDGSEINEVVSGQSNIHGLAFDRNTQLLYYGKGSYVYKASLDGKTDSYDFYGISSDVQILFRYQNFISWVYSNSSHPNVLSTRNQATGTNINEASFENSTLVDMKPLDEDLQKTDVTSPCSYNNGGCSQLCVTTYKNNVMERVCECSFGYTVENVVNCTTGISDDDIILMTDWGDEEIRAIHIPTNEVHIVPGRVSAQYMGVYFDPNKMKVIFAEYFSHEILAGNLNGTDRETLVDLGSTGYAYRFAMDMTTGNIYYSAYYDTYIGVVTPGGYFTKLKDDFGWDSVLDIGVHPEKGLMFYTVDVYPSGYVGRAFMDGSNATQIIKGGNVSYPDGLAINYLTDRLYWADADYDTIQDCDLDGKDCHTIVNMTGTGQVEEIRDIVTDGIYLYYSTYRNDHVVRVELKPPYKRTEVGQHHMHGKLDTLAYYSSTNQNKQKVSRDCSARNGLGPCSTICVPTPSGSKCACENGVSLKQDQKVCENIYQCELTFKQTVTLITNVEKFVTIEMDDTCSRLIDTKCNYKCEDNFEPLFPTLMVCTSAGWSMESRTLCKEVRCKVDIDNGKIDDTCKREIGDKCEYSCDVNYVKTKETAVCTKSGEYHVSDGDLCEPFKCTDTIPNGMIDKDCARTIGSSCKYSCNKKFYSPNTAYPMVKCMADGWSAAAADLCQELSCSEDSFLNGQLSNTCEKKLGQACTFECDQGYVSSTQQAFCKSDKMWHPRDACTPFLCSNTITNGKLGNGCARTVDSSCSYTCDKFYTPTVKKAEAMCQAGGWNPPNLCGEAICDDTSLQNGMVSGSCLKKIGDACVFDCNQGYVNTTHLAFCKNDKLWHPTDACSAFKCSADIENGDLAQGCSRNAGSKCTYTCKKHYSAAYKDATCTASGWVPASADLCGAVSCPSSVKNGQISMPCDLTVGSTCDYVCNDGYTATEVHPNVTCKRSGKWVTDNLCIVPPGKKFELSVPGVATGLSLLAIIVIILVVVLICLVRRKLSSSKYSNFDDSGTAIENPGYRSRLSYPDVKTDTPYDNVDDTQMKPVSTTSFSQGTVDEDGKL